MVGSAGSAGESCKGAHENGVLITLSCRRLLLTFAWVCSCVCVFRQKDNRPEGWRESPPPSLLALHTCRKSRQPLGPPTNCNMPLHSVHGCTALGGVLVPVSVSLSTLRVRHVWLSLKCGGGSWVAYDRPTTCYISGPTPPYIDHILDACPCMPRWKGQAKLKRNKSDNATGGGERIWWITLIKVI